jgi:oxygen-independent coproporphyrinogen-3 oxidase
VRIGRAHTVADVTAAYALARTYPFTVNMDLIAGLPGETAADTAASVRAAIALAPHNITVHTLALKAGSRLKEATADLSASLAATGLAGGSAAGPLQEAGYAPYYLYRQKYTVEALENTGYCRDAAVCCFNVDTMEETTTVLACGAGAISKILYGGNRIERVPNVKPLPEYLARFDEMLERKRAAL